MARRYKDTSLRDSETGKWDQGELKHRFKGAAAVLLSLAVLATGGWFVYGIAHNAWIEFRTTKDYIGSVGVEDITIVVEPGATINQIAAMLEEEDVVKTAKAFTNAASARPDEAQKLQAGKRKMRTQISGEAALDMLADTSRIERNFVQLREGYRMERQFEQLAKATGIPLKDFQAVAKKPDKLGLPKWAGGKPEGFFFPETYELPDAPTAEGILKTAVKQFNKVAKEINLEDRASELDMDPKEIVIVASLLEREVSLDQDRPKVARVIYNRLEKGMPLQLDSTVSYLSNKTGSVWTSDADRKSDSPYNTYKHKGLPPGPISSPSRKSLEAALDPAEGDWLFFVLQNLDTGETAFTNTLAEHNAAVQRLQQWCNASPENKKKCG